MLTKVIFVGLFASGLLVGIGLFQLGEHLRKRTAVGGWLLMALGTVTALLFAVWTVVAILIAFFGLTNDAFR